MGLTMTEVNRRVSFGDTSLHQPEFLDIHEVLQAASHPSVDSFQRAQQHLNSANHNRFVLLREVAREQAAGSGESDLRRMKRQFASLKNTFVLYDVKQSFIEGLGDGCPDGSEEAQMSEAEEEVEKMGGEVKQHKARNQQLQKEMEEVIEGIIAYYKEYSQQNAELANHLDCLAAEAQQRERSPLEPLPELCGGPNEEVCRVLLSNEAAEARNAETGIASDEAQVSELMAAIRSEEDEVQTLKMQIEELEMHRVEEKTQELTMRTADAGLWCEEMSALLASMTAVELLSATGNKVELKLTTALRAPLRISQQAVEHSLTLVTDAVTCHVREARLSPADLAVEDFVGTPGSRSVPSLVRVVSEGLFAKVASDCRAAELQEAQKRYSLAASDSAGVYSCVLHPAMVTAMVSVPGDWPADPTPPCILSLTNNAGSLLPLDVAGEKEAGALGLVALLEAAAAAQV